MHKQDIAKGRRLEPKVNVFKIDVKFWMSGEETNVTKLSQTEIWVRGPRPTEAMDDFLEILEILVILMPF